jgi:hypothetical protein
MKLYTIKIVAPKDKDRQYLKGCVREAVMTISGHYRVLPGNMVYFHTTEIEVIAESEIW